MSRHQAEDRAISGATFAALYDAAGTDLLAFLVRRTQTPEDAADCLAETFLIAWDKRDRIPAEIEQARPWLFGVARNVLRRGQQREHRASIAQADLARQLAGTHRQTPTDDPITEALKRLPTIDREIIEMLAWDQLAPREVAAILGLAPNVVRIRAHRARLKLRDELNSRLPAPQANG